MLVCFLFFKQKTAYELRISDWSSDVCSSDLIRNSDRRLVWGAACIDRCVRRCDANRCAATRGAQLQGKAFGWLCVGVNQQRNRNGPGRLQASERQRDRRGGEISGGCCTAVDGLIRTDERRVGEEWVSTGKIGW